jgi:hypothetical protein
LITKSNLIGCSTGKSAGLAPFTSSLSWRAFSSASRSARHRSGSNGIGKRAGPATYEDLVNAEMAKGLNAECAAQRVVQQHGFRALDYRALSKREQVSVVAEDELMKRAEDIFQDGELDRCASLRAARKQLPARLLKALQAS